MGKTYRKRKKRTDTLARIMSRCSVINENFNKTTCEDEDIGYGKIYDKGSAETKSDDVDTGIVGDPNQVCAETPSDEDTHWVLTKITAEEFRRPEVCHKRNRIVKSTRFHSCVRSRRVRNVTSVLRGRLSNNIFDRCFEKIWKNSPEEKMNQFTHFSSLWFYMYSHELYRERVLTWIKRKKIFSKKYVFVPIVIWSHWYLLILCNLGESLKSKTRTPCLLLLDSFHEADPHRLEPLLRRFVLDIYEAEDRPEDMELIKRIPLLVPKVPQQRNGDECGIFALYYSSLFLDNAPEDFSISKGDYPYFMKEDWFNEEELEGFYKRLESLGIESSDSDE